MRVQLASRPGSPDLPNEDAAGADRSTAVVVDGLTARTGTGCVHGTAWFAAELARQVLRAGGSGPAEALRSAVDGTAAQHRETCDLSDPATPCGAVGIVQVRDGHLHHLVLGDVTVVLAGERTTRVVSDHRIDGTARTERAEVDRLAHGSEARAAALVRMKQAEIGARNRPGGYWVAGADPAVVEHAVTGEVPLAELTRVALLSDGAARLVDLFHLTDWPGLLDLLATGGPSAVLDRVRAAERADADARDRPRNKVSDDATVVLCDEFHERECASR